MSSRRRPAPRAIATVIALSAPLFVLHCAGKDEPPTVADPGDTSAPPPPVVDAHDSDADAALARIEDDAASTAPAIFRCTRFGCPGPPDDDGGEAMEAEPCVTLGEGCKPCDLDGSCTGAPGMSIAICPYRYRYCAGLGRCVTDARYYALCPY